VVGLGDLLQVVQDEQSWAIGQEPQGTLPRELLCLPGGVECVGDP
jgi:hypothetical protein